MIYHNVSFHGALISVRIAAKVTFEIIFIVHNVSSKNLASKLTFLNLKKKKNTKRESYVKLIPNNMHHINDSLQGKNRLGYTFPNAVVGKAAMSLENFDSGDSDESGDFGESDSGKSGEHDDAYLLILCIW